MDNQTLRFDDFLESVDVPYRESIHGIHAFLLDDGYKLKLQTAKSGGYVVSYQGGKSKRVILNFVFRKTGLVARIYGDHVGRYVDFLHTLPETMVQTIEKSSSACRACNSRCPKGYVFAIREKQYNQCRYNCFMFPVNTESIPYIRTFLNNEIRERSA